MLITPPTLSAKSLVLDLLRMVYPMTLPVSLLVNAGRVLGLNENVLRVNITRLCVKSQIELDERGYYLLGKESEPHDEWLRQWQSGESRVRNWEGDWLVLNISSKLKKKDQQAVFKMADYFGFRELLPAVYVRPNNLQRSTEELSSQISKLSHIKDFVIFESNNIVQVGKSSQSQILDIKNLWDREVLELQYKNTISMLEEGIANVGSLSSEQAFKESYFVGAEVHHLLALDPLLPAELIDVKLREKVSLIFANYDSHYRKAWIEFFQGHVLKMNARKITPEIDSTFNSELNSVFESKSKTVVNA